MKKTLLLCFIHGFKGGDDTFGRPSDGFTEQLRQLVAAQLPKIDVRVVIYPKYDTRGDLAECVARFRDWLLEKVIDIEVDAGTPSPTVDPSVRTVLIGHSMGGIVAAETIMALTSEKPIPAPGSADDQAFDAEAAAAAAAKRPTSPSLTSLMFPYIQGLLAFDTPFLGISPGVVAHGAEGHYNQASAVLGQISGLSGALWGGGAAAAAGDKARSADGKRQAEALPMAAPPATASQDKNQKGNDGGAWGQWGKMAMIAGAGAAIAAGGAAAYMKREQISEGWSWASSHLAFVGCLARGEELRRRVAYMSRTKSDLGIGFANLYTRLGKAAAPKQVSMVGTVLGNQRTFCNLPTKSSANAGEWREAINDMATDETLAHTSMFEKPQNPGFEKLKTDAAELITSWAKNDWYESSAEEPAKIEL
ncbi:hypothetical protein MGG_12961 [Pyricularia oryzae 70-15]|uniref:DUF676 domain-containing protein n=1 Tax=Pyricularia oryzae (strain 70-15 / ATCC MYA-4617 / FGSC 8958) TaxID=242507 RepID=G4N3I8_PYRO7|nr:uncharacterized protein MGG_12961 [Pyricularia oryzae 70-15]EHA52663.1 hypothetical protein MGG_12961 [Pyricularia oryzae 70-15]